MKPTCVTWRCKSLEVSPACGWETSMATPSFVSSHSPHKEAQTVEECPQHEIQRYGTGRFARRIRRFTPVGARRDRAWGIENAPQCALGSRNGRHGRDVLPAARFQNGRLVV